MPKSKRAQKISLTQTRRKGLELKQKVIEEIRECVDQYARIFTFSVENMRNSKLKDVRAEWKHSRFFFGKNKVMAIALGHGEEDEYKDDLSKVSHSLIGQTGLLFTNKTKDEVMQWFSSYQDPDFARSGNKAQQSVSIQKGPLAEFSHAIEPQLRQLGLPTSLQRGVITLVRDFKICEKGDTLTPEQARILKLFGHMMADFKITINGVWSNDGTYVDIDAEEQSSRPKSVTVKPANKVESMDDITEAGGGDDSEEEEAED